MKSSMTAIAFLLMPVSGCTKTTANHKPTERKRRRRRRRRGRRKRERVEERTQNRKRKSERRCRQSKAAHRKSNSKNLIHIISEYPGEREEEGTKKGKEESGGRRNIAVYLPSPCSPSPVSLT